MTSHAYTDLIPLAEAAKLLPGARGNRHVTVATLKRWATHGARARLRKNNERVKLEIVAVGSRLFTSRDALDRFVHACSSAREGTRPAKARRKSHLSACLRLQQAGFGVPATSSELV